MRIIFSKGVVMARVVPAVLAALAALALTACSSAGGSESGNRAAVSSGDPAACPGDVVDVVVSVSQWGEIVRKLGGACTTVTTIVASGAIDPHDFEPRAADLAAFSKADLVVLNGADYDHWAADAVAGVDHTPAVVSAADVAGVPDHGTNPHLWYDPQVVTKVADAVSEQLSKLSPDAAPYFGGQHTAWTGELQPLLDEVAALKQVAAGRTYAATETVFDLMATAVGLTDVTPEGYRRSTSNESEPAPGDLSDFEAKLADGSVDVLVYNSQTAGKVPEQLRAAAEKARVPVVEVTESPPDANGSFVASQLGQLQALSDALDRTR
ncbi:MAG: zinc ABC transporter substrate-binding protein [Geodermatophilales bacterium]|nr:zinc ABC transporter substrate-binding protein [Geodermatophilales bacterium]